MAVKRYVTQWTFRKIFKNCSKSLMSIRANLVLLYR